MKNKVTVSFTTIAERSQSAEEAVKSLINQVDRINIYCHGYIPTTLPEIFKNKKVNVVYDLEYGDHGDLDKFHWIDEIKEGYHFIIDDDLIFDKKYISETIAELKRSKLENKAVFSYHGVILKKLPIAHYYKDRIVLPALGEVKQTRKVNILGTGVLVYNANYLYETVKDFKNEIVNFTPNMADIHFSVYLLEKNIELYVLKHKKGFIKESDKYDKTNTIFHKNVLNPYLMTEKVNNNKDLFETLIKNEKYLPLITIATVVTRLKTNPDYVQSCFDSIRDQSYSNIEHIVIDNNDKLLTIGKAYNEAVKKAKGEYVLFIGDDDFITTDYVSSLVDAINNKYNENIVGATSYLTMFRQMKTGEVIQEQKRLIPTGMWNRKFLLENPFLEYLNKYVDTELMERAKNMGYYQICVTHCYGYFYRSHEFQTSGFKTLSNEEGKSVNNKQIMEFINKYR